jgi:hypothetical protein
MPYSRYRRRTPGRRHHAAASGPSRISGPLASPASPALIFSRVMSAPRPTPACFSMTARVARCGSSPWLATVAYFVPMVRFLVRRSRPTTAVARLGLLRLDWLLSTLPSVGPKMSRRISRARSCAVLVLPVTSCHPRLRPSSIATLVRTASLPCGSPEISSYIRNQRHLFIRSTLNRP